MKIKKKNIFLIVLTFILSIGFVSMFLSFFSSKSDTNIDFESTWKNKKAVFIGDSITYGVGTNTGNRYFEYLNEELLFSGFSSYGISGSCVSSKSDYGTTNTPLINRWETIATANQDVDLVVIFMGTNDYGHGTPLGTISDSADISFYGALNVIIKGLKDKLPNATICWITPLHRYGYGGFTFDSDLNASNCCLADYTNAIIDVCKKYDIEYFNSFNIPNFNPSDNVIKSKYFPDGLHPNADGHLYLSNHLVKWLNKL